MESPWSAAMRGTEGHAPPAGDTHPPRPAPAILDDIHAMLDLVLAAVAAARPGAGMHTTGILDGIGGTTRRARDLIESLQRPGEPHAATAGMPTDANALLRGLRSRLAASLPPGVELRMRLAPALWPAEAEAAGFETAMLRLVARAATALRDCGQGALCILTENVIDRTANGEAAEFIRISVVDDGDGGEDTAGMRARPGGWRFADPTFEEVRRFAAQGEGWLEVRSLEGIGTAVHLHLRRAAPGPPESLPGSQQGRRPPVHHAQACGAAA